MPAQRLPSYALRPGLPGTTASPHNPGTVTTSLDPDQLPPDRDTFGAQTPVALVAIAAVAAILLVNSWTAPASRSRVAPTLAPALVDWSDCNACGQIVRIRARAAPVPADAPTFEIDIRMRNGTQRTIEQHAPGLMVGDHVRLTGGTLTLQD